MPPASDQGGEVEVQGGSDSLLGKRAARWARTSRTAFGGTGMDFKGCLPLAEDWGTSAPFGCSGEATAGARLRVDELALG